MPQHPLYAAIAVTGLGVSCLTLGLMPVTVSAAALDEPVVFDIPAQPLESALLRFSQQAGVQLLTSSDELPPTVSSAVTGRQLVSAALAVLLKGTGLTYEVVKEGTVAIHAPGGRSAGAVEFQGESAIRLARLGAQQSGEAVGASADDQSAAGAQAESSREKLEEVVVLGAKHKFAPRDSAAATRIPMDLIETPQALSIVSSELMSTFGTANVETALMLVPGVTINSNGDLPAYIEFSVRGFVASLENSAKINGMPITNGPGYLDGGVMERVEVVRGPASIIYGQSDYGGTINMQLKAPQSKWALGGELGTSIDGGLRALGDVTGPLNSARTLRGRLIVISDDTRTRQQFTFRRTSTIAPGFSWDITDDTVLDVNYLHSSLRSLGSGGFGITVDGVLPKVSDTALLNSADDILDTSNDVGIVKLTQRFGHGWSAALAGSYARYNNFQRSSSISGPIPSDGIVGVSGYIWHARNVDQSGELNVYKEFEAMGRSNTLLLNVARRKTNAPFAYAVQFDPAALGTIDVYHPNSYAVPSPYSGFPEDLLGYRDPVLAQEPGYYAAYTETRYSGASALLLLHPLPRLSLLTGARRESFEQTSSDYWDRSVSFQTPDRFKSDATTYRAGLVYELLPEVNLYASYSTGFLFGVALDKDGTALAPETGVQWEAGAKASLLDRKLLLSGSVFWIDRKNVKAHDPTEPPASPALINISGERHEGAEFEILGEPIPGWNITASAAFLDVNISDAPYPEMIGQQPRISPHTQLKLYTNYQLLSGPLRGLSFGGGAFRSSSMQADSFGTFRLPAWTRFDLRVGYDGFEKVSFAINATNVTHAKAYTSQYSAFTGVDFQSRPSIMARVEFKY